MSALIDTGADITVIRRDIFFLKNISEYEKLNIEIKGLSQTVKTIGVFKTNIEVDDDNFIVNCYILHEKDLSEELIIGWNLLQQANTQINARRVTIT